MDIKIKKFKTLSNYNAATINRGDIAFVEDTHAIFVDSVAYGSLGVQEASITDDVLTILNENGESLEIDLKMIPYDSKDGDIYTINNKELKIKDSENSNAETSLNGQNLIVYNVVDGKVLSGSQLSYDSVTVISANDDIMTGDPSQYTTISLDPANETYGVRVGQVFNSGDTVIQSVSRATSNTYSVKNSGEDIDTTIEIGLGSDAADFMNNGDFIIKITDGEDVSKYAVRNAKLNNSETAYLATEAYVLAHAGGGSIDDNNITETTTWSSKKISENLAQSDNIKYYETKDEWRADTTRAIPCICYIKDVDKILIDNGAEIAEPYIWNMSESGFAGLGAISSTTTINDLTLTSGIQVNAYRTTIDNVDYSYRAYMSDAGSTTSRSLSFDLTGNDDIEILFQAGGNNRTLRLAKADGTVIRTFTGTTAQWHKFHYSGDACKAYLYMVSGSGYIYSIKLNV